MIPVPPCRLPPVLSLHGARRQLAGCCMVPCLTSGSHSTARCPPQVPTRYGRVDAGRNIRPTAKSCSSTACSALYPLQAYQLHHCSVDHCLHSALIVLPCCLPWQEVPWVESDGRAAGRFALPVPGPAQMQQGYGYAFTKQLACQGSRFQGDGGTAEVL